MAQANSKKLSSRNTNIKKFDQRAEVARFEYDRAAGWLDELMEEEDAQMDLMEERLNLDLDRSIFLQEDRDERALQEQMRATREMHIDMCDEIGEVDDPSWFYRPDPNPIDPALQDLQ